MDPTRAGEYDSAHVVPLLSTSSMSASESNFSPMEDYGDNSPQRESQGPAVNARANASRMRTSILTRLWRELQSSRIAVAYYIVSMLVQVTACATVLLMEKTLPCDTPLRIFLLVTAIEVSLRTPLHVYQRISRRPQPTDASQVPDANMADRLISLLEFFGVIWFVAGNWWLFTSQTCSASSPLVYFMSLAFVVLGYCIMLLPLLLCIGMICCFPCLLIAMRFVQIESPHGSPATLIQSIPVETFKLGAIAPEDAMCAICLADYVDGEELKRLHCNHHFHSKCLDDWLPLSKNCPLCMQKIDEPLQGQRPSNADNA